MVALGEERDRIDARRLERSDEVLGVPIRADIRDEGRGVEVEVNLA